MIKYIKSKLSRIDREQNTFLIVIFVIALMLSISFLIGAEWSKARIGQVEDRLSSLAKQNIAFQFDRQRLQDVQNILLALQDYKFDNNSFPQTLSVLKQKGYLKVENSLQDPSTGAPYYYLNRGKDFVLCVWLSDSIKGVNMDSCPAPL